MAELAHGLAQQGVNSLSAKEKRELDKDLKTVENLTNFSSLNLDTRERSTTHVPDLFNLKGPKYIRIYKFLIAQYIMFVEILFQCLYRVKYVT